MMSTTETTPTTAQPDPQPSTSDGSAQEAFGEIALALSGGGYRGAAFHLGVIDIPERLGILREVRVLSTVSGGTITGMAYAVSVSEHSKQKTFDDFYKQVYV